jgi:hypothetical protein
MANQTSDREPNRQEGLQLALKSNNLKFFRGALAMFDATSGLVVKAADTAGGVLAGVVAGQVDNTALAAGVGRVELYRKGVFEFVYGPGGATDALVGDTVVIADDQTVTTPGVAANDVTVGSIVEVVSATKVRVEIKTGA